VFLLINLHTHSHICTSTWWSKARGSPQIQSSSPTSIWIVRVYLFDEMMNTRCVPSLEAKLRKRSRNIPANDLVTHNNYRGCTWYYLICDYSIHTYSRRLQFHLPHSMSKVKCAALNFESNANDEPEKGSLHMAMTLTQWRTLNYIRSVRAFTRLPFLCILMCFMQFAAHSNAHKLNLQEQKLCYIKHTFDRLTLSDIVWLIGFVLR